MHVVLCLLACTVASAEEIPPIPREFRAAWVATVANIDWPSRKGLSTADQQRELRAVMDSAVKIGLNAIVFQVRPMCDALYESKLEPWSEFLTGKLGVAPSPKYDPLDFAVREAHARGLELHAWFNPYRAHAPSAKSEIPPDHLVRKRPDLAKKYGRHYWLDPGEPEVQAHSLAVIRDVVKRYDVDGVHLDDYFFPYKEKDDKGKIIPFPDDASWDKYRKSGGTIANRDDWRRHSVDEFVRRLYDEVKAEKRWVRVGISPFGIWRPGNPPGIKGFDQYAELYADARRWLREGWVDYWTPQLYWQIQPEAQSYPKLLGWWAGENVKHRHLWPGNYSGRVTGREKGWPAQELADQISATRNQNGATGNVFFSMKSLQRNSGGVGDAIASMYREPALPPPSPWLCDKAPAKPDAEVVGDSLKLGVPPENVRWFAVATKTAGKWKISIRPAAKSDGFAIPAGSTEVAVAAVDRTGVASDWKRLSPGR